jgi:hypothetical protein
MAFPSEGDLVIKFSPLWKRWKTWLRALAVMITAGLGHAISTRLAARKPNFFVSKKRLGYLYAVAAALLAALASLQATAVSEAMPVSAQVIAAPSRAVAGLASTGLPNPAGPVRLTVETSVKSAAPAPPLAAHTATPDTSWDNLFQDYGDKSGAWSGGDGAQSLLLPDGKTMWFFGDTYLGDTNPDYTRPPLNTGLAHNSAVLQSGSTLGPTFATAPGKSGYSFKDDYSWVGPPSGYSASRYEVINGDQVFDKGVVYKFMQLADRDLHPDNFEYKLVGTTLQSFTYNSSNGHLTPKSSSVVSVADSASSDPVIWGAALLKSSGYIYIYGVRPYDKASLYLARVPVGQLASIAKWSYWDAAPGCSAKSGSWSSNAASAKPLMAGVSEGFSVTDVEGTFVLLSNDNNSGATNNAVVHYASCPTGFAATGRAYTIYQPDVPFGYLTYEYRILPQFSNGSDVLVSYSTDSARVDDSCLYENYYDARIYRPRFLVVQLPGFSPSGPVTQVKAPAPPVGTTPPVPPSQETFHPTGPTDNWAASNCQAGTAPSSTPKVAVTSNVNGKIALSWTMAPTAMWLYSVTYCNITTLGKKCGTNNSSVVPKCPGQNLSNCQNILVWGSRTITLLYLTGGDEYQFTIETSKAVIDNRLAYSNAVRQDWPGPTGCAPLRSGNSGYHYFTGAVADETTTVGGVSATIENYSPWVAPQQGINDTTSEWVMLVDDTHGGDQTYAQVGWWQGPYYNRETFVEWAVGGPDFRDYYYPPYPVNSNVTYTVLFKPGSNPDADGFRFEADGNVLLSLPSLFTPYGGQILSETHDQASQVPGDPSNQDHVSNMRINFPAGSSGKWNSFAGTLLVTVQSDAGAVYQGEPWQEIDDYGNNPDNVDSFATEDGDCEAPSSRSAMGGGTSFPGRFGRYAATTAILAQAARHSLAQANPVSAAMLEAMNRDSETRITPVSRTAVAPAVTSSTAEHAAERAALAQAPPGSRVLGIGLARTVIPYYGSVPQLVWLVSVDQAGGLQSVSHPERTANFDVALVSASTGKWLMTSAGLAPKLLALPAIPAVEAIPRN